MYTYTLYMYVYSIPGHKLHMTTAIPRTSATFDATYSYLNVACRNKRVETRKINLTNFDKQSTINNSTFYNGSLIGLIIIIMWCLVKAV